ncbi:MAG: class I SAM-dependent methyltransferase [Thermoleophilia bacterium]
MDAKSTFERCKQDWEELTAMDTCWSILAAPGRKNGRWDLEEFFVTGEVEIGRVMCTARELGVPAGRATALDFGCGVGRLTRALGRHFDDCSGIDISERMIDLARELNRSVTGCRFKLNQSDDLGDFADQAFDMIYTSIVLQHVPCNEAIRAYIAEFIRTLKHGGLLVFQLPSRISRPRRFKCALRRGLYSSLRAAGGSEASLFRLGLHPIRNSFVSEAEVVELIRSRGGEILRVETDDSDNSFVSSTYFVTR